jgi:hypothetical protein
MPTTFINSPSVSVKMQRSSRRQSRNALAFCHPSDIASFVAAAAVVVVVDVEWMWEGVVPQKTNSYNYYCTYGCAFH